MILAEETLGVNLVNIFRTRGRAANQPFFAITLIPPIGLTVSGSRRQNLLDFFAGNFGNVNVGRGQFRERGFLFRRGGSLDAFIDGIAQVTSKFTIDFARIFSQARRDFRREQAGDDSVFVSRPDAAVAPEKRRARAFFAREAQAAQPAGLRQTI